MYNSRYISRTGLIAVLLLCGTLLTAGYSLANGITGKVTDVTGSPVPTAAVVLVGTDYGASADLDGFYTITNVPPGTYTIEATHLGYHPSKKKMVITTDPLVSNFRLEFDAIALEEMTVRVKRAKSHISTAEPVRKEVIVAADLAKTTTDGSLLSAMGSQTGLNTRPCALCGSASIGLQGMDPNYTEITVDGMSVMSGLGSLYGLSGVAVADVSSVSLVKGSSSSDAGAGAIAGSVDITTRRAAEQPQLQLDGSLGETMVHSANAALSHRLGTYKYRLSFNYGAQPNRIDRNSDHLTLPPTIVFGEGLSGETPLGSGSLRTSFRYFTEQRFAGDVNWTTADRGSATVYGRDILIERYEGGFRYGDQSPQWGEWSFESAYVDHKQDSWYGKTKFDALQRKSNSRLTISKEWNPAHYTVFQGLYSYEEYSDNLKLANPTDRLFRIPGVAIQHTYKPNLYWQTEVGGRLEHYEADGLVPTLRGALMYKPGADWTLRLSVGSGYRPITLFSLDAAVHNGFDKVHLPKELISEKTVNGTFGVNYNVATTTDNYTADLSMNAIKFWNKAIIEFGHTAGHTYYSNALDANSKNFELQLGWNNSSGWQLGAGATYTDVQYEDSTGWRTAEMQNHYTANLSVNHTWTDWKFSAGARSRLYGPQTLPEGRSRSESPVFVITDLNARKEFGAIHLTLTVSNITDWVQPDNPFVMNAQGNEIMDSAMIYGPLLGRVVQLGVAYTIPLGKTTN